MSVSMEIRVNETVQKIIHMFETGNIPEAICLSVIPRTIEIPSSSWSIGNRLLMLAANTCDARGYKQWQKVGRYVKKGAKAIYILAPCTIKYKNLDDGEEKITVVGYRSVPVFRYEDTYGQDLPALDYKPLELPPLHQVAASLGLEVKYMPYIGHFRGYYHPKDKLIMLCTHDIRTWFHELAHAVHDHLFPLKTGQVPSQEIVAETVAACLCQLYGYSGYIYYGREYIAHYAKDAGPVWAIMQVLNEVELVLKTILSLNETPVVK